MATEQSVPFATGEARGAKRAAQTPDTAGTDAQAQANSPAEAAARAQAVTLREKYWKPRSRIWPIAQLAALGAALLVSLFVPTVEFMVEESYYRIVLAAAILILVVRLLVGRVNKSVGARANHQAQFYTGVGVVLIVWDLLTTKSATMMLPFFPSIGQILQVLVEDWQTLLISTAYSLRLLVIGFAVGTAIGLVSGVLIGWNRQWNYWMFPFIKVLSVIPATAWIPIAMILLPSSFYAEIFLITLCVWFPVAYMTCTGIENVPKSYFEAARTLGAKRSYLIFHVAVPGAMPSIFTGIYTATGISFATLVVAEIIGAKAGLGWYINWAKGWSNYAKVYAAILIMAIVFSLVMSGIFRLRDRVLIWQKGLLK